MSNAFQPGRNDARRMAILMHYEQVQRAHGGGLAAVAERFGISFERVRFIVKREQAIARQGDRPTLRSSLPEDLRRKVYASS